MKRRLAIALLSGAFLSISLAVLESLIRHTFLEVLQTPGLLVIFLLWGHGGTVPGFVIGAVIVGINAVVYGLIVWTFLGTRKPG